MLPQVIEMKPNELGIWEREDSLQQIKASYGRNLSTTEFNILIQIGKATNLSPFLREIWAVKYGNEAAQIFIGRDGYRKSAQAHYDYDYHLVDAVYSNDDFNVETGTVSHKYNLKDRGDLLGAYCIVKRKGSERPMYTFVELKEYSTNKSLWKQAGAGGKPATMIKKVAEAQGLRQAFQELFAGTYHEFENWRDDQPQLSVVNKGVQGLKQKLGIIPANTYNTLASKENVEKLRELVTKADLSQETIQRWLDKAKAKTFEEMPEECVLKCIDYLQKKEGIQNEL